MVFKKSFCVTFAESFTIAHVKDLLKLNVYQVGNKSSSKFFQSFVSYIKKTQISCIIYPKSILIYPEPWCNQLYNIALLERKAHCMKIVQIRSFLWSVFSRIFPLSVFSLNAGKYGPEKLRIWTLFTQWRLFCHLLLF